MSVNHYERVIIEGQMECLAELSIGSGEISEYTDKGKDNTNVQREFLQICTDQDGKPYIPATSLRGLLGDLCRQLDPARHLALFGIGRDDGGKTGALRVYDATFVSAPAANGHAIHERLHRHADADTVLRHRAAIDPITGTAADQQLFTVAAVPTGSVFQCRLELERVGETELACLLGLLNQLDGEAPQSRLGKGANRQAGRVKWKFEADKLKAMTQEGLAAWLIDGKEDSPLPFVQIPPNAVSYTQIAKRHIRIPFKLHPTGPLLVDPVQVPKAARINEDEPHMLFRRNQHGQLLLPAASLRGLLRAHCRKILMTLLVDKTGEQPPYGSANEIADKMIDQLFGHTGKRSAIILTDAEAQHCRTHPQTFIAVDRFTGGVAKGALYSVEAATVEELTGELLIESRLLPLGGVWCFGLLALALRDGMEGDFALGWGKAKGYGSFTVAVDWYANGDFLGEWEVLIKQNGILKITAWVNALHSTINREIKSQQAHVAGAQHG